MSARVDRLNAEVTNAILAAERHQYDAVDAWKRVARAERALAECEDVPKLQRQIAQEGYLRARRRAKKIRKA